ncbi:DUF4136 domain-containing protein [Microbulbifer sp.]|uniref:DUF4136 domain-containing protein n=1 Tax=Microbulbifer sp. TaxID=1908541 RepID=UPI0025864793|nr:DUF4136 domain-containing protein [Microbulbifer sp.]
MRIHLAGLTALLLMLVGLAACTPTQVSTIEPAAGPVQFSTYAWGTEALTDVSGASSAQMVELDTELRDIVGGLLNNRGYVQVDNPANADMVVDYQVAVIEEQFASESAEESWNAQFDSNATRGVVELPSNTGAPRVTLSVGIGPLNGSPMWGGSATKLIAHPESANARQRLLSKTVGDLLEDLPPAR